MRQQLFAPAQKLSRQDYPGGDYVFYNLSTAAIPRKSRLFDFKCDNLLANSQRKERIGMCITVTKTAAEKINAILIHVYRAGETALRNLWRERLK